MKIKVPDIPEDGMELNASSSQAQDRWFEEVVEKAFEEDFPKGNSARLNLHLLRTSDNVQVSGTAEIDLKPACDRCLEVFEKHTTVPLHVNLAPRNQMHFEEGESEEGLDEDDVAFSFYKGEEIDLSEILREMFVLDIPLRYLCSETCKGLCPRCGKNLNLGPCGCSAQAGDSRFAALKQLLKPTE
ncbi:MAG TPA: DUF177 domain-containing protein [bacterium]|nr:DUF177 domain-containing protein [bacterium]